MCMACWDSGLHILEFSLTHRERECEVLKSDSLSAEVLFGGGGGGGIVWETCTLWIGCRWMSF